MELLTPRLLIREWTQEDFPSLFTIEADPIMQQFEKDKIPDEQVVHKILDEIIRSRAEQPRKVYSMAVVLLPGIQVIGKVHLDLNFENIREWEIGYMIHHPFWGNGYACEAVHKLLGFAFTQLNAHKIIAFCNAENKQSIRVMEKSGLQREGYLRETRWLNNSWHDECVYAILDHEWVE